MPQLRIIHIALCLGAAMIAVVLGALHSLLPDTAVELPTLLPWVFLGLSGVMLLSAAAFRTTIPPADTAMGEEAWLTANRGKGMILWALCESSVVLAALAFFFGASTLFAGILAAGSLGFMASQSPGTLAGH